MRAAYRFFRPTVPKLIFTAGWVTYLLRFFKATSDRLTNLHQLAVVLWPPLLFYCLMCTLVAWSQRANRIASNRGLATFVVIMVALDQICKTVISVLLSPDTTLPLVTGWLHLTNVHNVAGSWILPVRFKPVLTMVSLLGLPTSIIIYRYYISSHRRSLWVDLTLVSILVAYTSWLCDMVLRGYTLDFIAIPDIVAIPKIVAFDFKDVFASLVSVSAIAEMLDNPRVLPLRWDGWRAELESTRRLVTDITAFAAGDLRSCWVVARKKLDSISGDG